MNPNDYGTNEEENLNQNPEEIQEQAQEEKDHETNKRVAKIAAKGAANYFAPGVGGKAVDVIAKTEIGNKVLDKGGEVVTKLNKKMPFGGKVQDTLNKADDSGALDMAESAVDSLGGDPTSGATNAATSGIPNLGKTDSLTSGLDKADSLLPDANESGSSKSGFDITDGLKLSPMNPTKIFAIGGIGLFLFILLIIILSNQSDMLRLTDEDDRGITTNSNYDIVISDAQIEKLLIYVGDSRINNIKNSINNNDITYISADSSGYLWYIDTAIKELESYIGADTSKYVVITLGLNDLHNIDKYINVYNTLINKYENVKIYFMSVNPVIEELALLNNYNITNADIINFNNQLSSSFNEFYIDTYKEIENNINTNDGIHYDDTTNKTIHKVVLNYIKSKNTFKFLERYPSISETTNLKNSSLLSVIGDSGINEIEAQIQEKINFSGNCSSSAVAGAAVGLIHGLYTKGVSIPYYYGGRYYGNSFIDRNWGANIGASTPTPKGNIHYYSGLDCSGFIHWAITAAGIKSDAGTAESYLNRGKHISYGAAYPGALLVEPAHIAIIIDIDNDNIQTAESTTGGVQFKKYTKNQIEKRYKIVDMNPYYQEKCNS